MADPKKSNDTDTHTVGIDAMVHLKLRDAARDRMVGMGWLASKLLAHALDRLPDPVNLFGTDPYAGSVATEDDDAPDA